MNKTSAVTAALPVAPATGETHTTALVTYAGLGVPVWPATWTWEGTLSY